MITDHPFAPAENDPGHCAFCDEYDGEHGPTADVHYEGETHWHGQLMRRWTVALTYQGRSMTVPFYTGLGLEGEPTAADVLECLAWDASLVDECGDDPDEWAAHLGEPESIKQLLETIKQASQQTAELRRLLGDDYDLIAEGVREQ
jgi:hypothetical protein